MTEDRFDDLTRRLARHPLRRPLVTTAAWGVVAVLAGLLRLGVSQSAAGTVSGPAVRPQDPVSSAAWCYSVAATDSPSVCVSTAGAIKWTGRDVTAGGTPDGPLQPLNQKQAVAAGARDDHGLSPALHPPRSTRDGPPGTLATASGGPNDAAVACNRLRAGGSALSSPSLKSHRTRGPPLVVVMAEAPASFLPY